MPCTRWDRARGSPNFLRWPVPQSAQLEIREKATRQTCVTQLAGCGASVDVHWRFSFCRAWQSPPGFKAGTVGLVLFFRASSLPFLNFLSSPPLNTITFHFKKNMYPIPASRPSLAERWESLKPNLERLYLTEKLSLAKVMNTMKQAPYFFDAKWVTASTAAILRMLY